MAVTYQAVFKLAFRDATDRTIKFNGIDAEIVDGIKRKVIAINDSLTAGEAEYFAKTFVSDNGADCIMISSAQVISTDEEVIYNAS